jgi:hypothetical protein
MGGGAFACRRHCVGLGGRDRRPRRPGRFTLAPAVAAAADRRFLRRPLDPPLHERRRRAQTGHGHGLPAGPRRLRRGPAVCPATAGEAPLAAPGGLLPRGAFVGRLRPHGLLFPLPGLAAEAGPTAAGGRPGGGSPLCLRAGSQGSPFPLARPHECRPRLVRDAGPRDPGAKIRGPGKPAID